MPVQYLDAAGILGADDLEHRDVPVPEWGGTVRVRGLTARERDQFEFAVALARKDATQANVRASFVGRAIVDADGRRVLTDGQIGQLAAKSATAVDRVMDVVRELSGMGDDAVEDAAEGFGQADDDGSSTA